MDVLDALSAIENRIQESPWIPFARLRAVDREAIQRLLQTARLEAERLQQAPPNPPIRAEVLNRATNEGRLLLEGARRQADETLRDDRIKVLALQRFDDIVGDGQLQADTLIQHANGYSAQRIAGVEQQLIQLRQQVEDGLEIVEKGIKEAHKAQRQHKKEGRKETFDL